MNLINLRAISGGACAPCSADLEDDVADVRSFRQSGRTFRRRYLHMLYRETLRDYHKPTSDWMRRATRQTLLNIWENYRNA